jgi:uncharacterized membrane protein
MAIRRADVLGLALIGGVVVLAATLYGRIPATVPTHWNWAGQPDGFLPKPLGVFVLPLVAAVTWAVLAVLPALSPRGFSMERFRGTYDVLRTTIVGFVVLVATAQLLVAAGWRLRIDVVIPVAVGLLLAILGNYMGKVRRNFFVGIRTPWTLASEEVWLRTHRVAGKLFAVAGVLVAAGGLLGAGVWVLPVTVGAAALGSVAVSYVYFRQVERRSVDP